MIPISNMHNFFAALSPEVQAEIDAVSTFRNVAQGDMIVRASDACGELYRLCEDGAK